MKRHASRRHAPRDAALAHHAEPDGYFYCRAARPPGRERNPIGNRIGVRSHEIGSGERDAMASWTFNLRWSRFRCRVALSMMEMGCGKSPKRRLGAEQEKWPGSDEI